jgi:hypothetical protein
MIKPEKSYMLAHQAINTETIVYVRLLDEGVDVWRPVRATAQPDGTFKLVPPEKPDPTEVWEFPPHATVRCVQKTFEGGNKGLVAIAQTE